MQTLLRAVIAAALCAVSTYTFAADLSWQVTVAAGETDRTNTPVVVPVTVDAEHAESTLVELTADGQTIVGQLTQPGLLSQSQDEKPNSLSRELHFILPELKAGKSVTYQVKSLASSSEKSFAWKDTPGKQMDLTFGDRPVVRYMYERVDNSSKERRGETFKVYHHVFDPSGERLVTKGPGGLFPHHRGLFFGFNKITYDGNKSADVWHCNNGESQTHEKVLAQEAGPVLARQTLAIAWHGKDDKVFANEERELTVYNTPGGTLIGFASQVKAVDGQIKLDGDPQHAGFHFRASQDVPDKTAKQTYYVRPDGKDTPGKFRNWPGDKQHVNLAWNALSFVLGDQRYTCCYLDRPENPKESRFSERDYGRFGSYFEYTIDQEHPLRVAYRVWLQPGEMDVAQVSAKSADFVSPPVATAK